MKRIKMHHFGGKNICATWDEVAQALEQTVDGVNEFYIAAEHTMFPYLAVLVKGDYAYVHCVPNETDGGLIAFSADTPTDLPPDGISIFYTNTPLPRKLRFRLECSHRQSEASAGLTRNVTQFPKLLRAADLSFDDSFQMRLLPDPDIQGAVCEEAAKRYLAGESVQLLSPFNAATELSVAALNRVLRPQVNPRAGELEALDTAMQCVPRKRQSMLVPKTRMALRNAA